MMRKEVIVAHFNLLSQHLAGRTEEKILKLGEIFQLWSSRLLRLAFCRCVPKLRRSKLFVYFIICGLCNDAVDNSDYAQLGDMMTNE
jgi:hypothetical protein